jgi:uncharacterized protein (DUF433 family)
LRQTESKEPDEANFTNTVQPIPTHHSDPDWNLTRTTMYARDDTEAHAMTEFDRITHTPDVMAGKACIRGMRVTVGMILGQLGSGTTVDELLQNYPYLEREDIMQALLYGAWLTRAHEVELAEA